jgi:hypothetical protein
MTNDEDPIDNACVDSVCKLGQGKDCCRYLARDAQGFKCLKLTELRYHLDERVKRGTMNARGDNCEGWSVIQVKKRGLQ